MNISKEHEVKSYLRSSHFNIVSYTSQIILKILSFSLIKYSV